MTLEHFSQDALLAGDGVVQTTQTSVVVVRKGLTATLAEAGVVYGVASQAASAGGAAVIVTADMVGPSITGLAAGNAGKVRINPATGRLERVAAFVAGDYPVGFVNSAGWLRVLPGLQVQ